MVFLSKVTLLDMKKKTRPSRLQLLVLELYCDINITPTELKKSLKRIDDRIVQYIAENNKNK